MLAEALVLRTVDFSETSLVVHLLTRQHGKIAALAKGAKRLKSPFENSLDLLAEISVAFIHKSSDALDLLTESKLLRRFRPKAGNLAGVYAGYLVAELLDSLLEEGEAVPEIFDAAVATLRRLESGTNIQEDLARFEWYLLVMLGHQLLFDRCAGCGRLCDLARERTLPVSVAEGGVLCPECHNIQHVVRIHAATLRTLNNLEIQPILTEILTTETLKEIRKLLSASFCHLLGRPPKLYDYWKIIDK